MQRPLGIGRNLVRMGPRHVGGRHAQSGAPLERDAVEVTLSRVVRRGEEIEPAPLLVDGFDMHDVKSARGDWCHLGAVPRDAVSMLPAVAIAQPDQLLALVEPAKIVVVLYPGGVPFGQ